jgi:hypothetical protein
MWAKQQRVLLVVYQLARESRISVKPRLGWRGRLGMTTLVFCMVTLAAQVAPGAARAAHRPHLHALQVRHLALRTGRRFLDSGSPTEGLPLRVVSVRRASSSKGLLWIVLLRAHYFIFPCPPALRGTACVATPSEYAVVRIRDATGHVLGISPSIAP